MEYYQKIPAGGIAEIDKNSIYFATFSLFNAAGL